MIPSATKRLIYFWIGILATFMYRIIIVLNNYSQVWVQIAWYIGTIGFIIYFIHRYTVSEKRLKLIEQYKLDEKVKEAPNMSEEEKKAAYYILSTLHSSKERWNDIFIFASSGIALALGLYLDFMR